MALGTFRIFLPDGTLVMDSCVETYRLANWRAIDSRRVEWREDTATIEAEIAQSSPDESRNSMGAPVFATPAIAGNSLILRTTDAVYAVGER